jgi:hypothetical protein
MTVEQLANLMLESDIESNARVDIASLEWMWLPHDVVLLAATHGALVMPEQATQARDLYVRLVRERLERERSSRGSD